MMGLFLYNEDDESNFYSKQNNSLRVYIELKGYYIEGRGRINQKYKAYINECDSAYQNLIVCLVCQHSISDMMNIT